MGVHPSSRQEMLQQVVEEQLAAFAGAQALRVVGEQPGVARGGAGIGDRRQWLAGALRVERGGSTRRSTFIMNSNGRSAASSGRSPAWKAFCGLR